MTERDKIIEILNKSFMQKEVTPVFVADDGQETELPQELCEIFNDIVSQGAIPYFADALLANGYGDVSEWKRKAELAEKELEKHKKALIDMCKEYEKDITCIHMYEGCEDECYMCAYNNRLRIAEREIEEERK